MYTIKNISRRVSVCHLTTALVSTMVLMPLQAQAQTTVVTPNTDMEEILVEGQVSVNPALSSAIPKNSSALPAADGGDFLRSLPGVDGSRMGGHGIDPVIRGQARTQLNIINNGVFTYNGCPNRMDPPSSYSDIQTTDLVIVQRGYQSVQYGPGGTGGTVIFEHQAPTFEEGQTLKAAASAGYESNGDIFSLSGDGSAKVGAGYVRTNGHFKDAGNYEDGSGKEVRSSFKQYGGSVEAGLKDEDTEASVGMSYERIEDALFAGAGMDSPQSENISLRGSFDQDLSDTALIRAVHVNAYWSDVDHVMDNFSLRDRMMMFREADTSTTSYGGKFVADLEAGETKFNVGVDLQNRNMDGVRIGNDMNPDMLNFVQAVLIPDVDVNQIGFFIEGTTPVAEKVTLKAGLRYDHVSTSHNAADQVTTMGMLRSPNALYQKYYGVTAKDKTEDNVSGLLRLEYNLSASSTAYFGVSRSIRTADITERSIASDMGNVPMMNMSWIGNPNLAPEKHYQIDAGYGLRRDDWSLLLSAYYDEVDDYIFRDHARGQDGILVSDGALIYRNIDARLWGIEAEGSLKLADKLTLAADAAYTSGQNKDLDIPLPQIPPFSGKLSLTYEEQDWELGGRMRWAVTQTRVDDNAMTGSGRDVQETPGWAVFDLFGRYDLTKGITVRAGVSNILDKTYANHLNRENTNDGTEIQVNEPGRSFYIRLQATL
ncbi:TonB-dependent copper receptor [Emcibacter sp.]|uniref:TonB-dependent copper receptor n=1 Tax=Emcibacter sp. TaxID=1979954 RepID=UPI002AA78191|nr:TonB-dependent copper receptor [Emcibacter sp.]